MAAELRLVLDLSRVEFFDMREHLKYCLLKLRHFAHQLLITLNIQKLQLL